jgi:hypothetical protein
VANVSHLGDFLALGDFFITQVAQIITYYLAALSTNLTKLGFLATVWAIFSGHWAIFVYKSI